MSFLEEPLVLLFASDWQLLIFLILVLTAAPSPWPGAGWGQGEVFLISAPRPQARLLHSHQHSHPPPDLRGRSETGPDSEEEWWSLKNTKHRIKNMFSKQSRKTRRLKRILWLSIQNIFRRILKTCFQMASQINIFFFPWQIKFSNLYFLALPGVLVAGSSGHAPLAYCHSHWTMSSNICSKWRKFDYWGPEKDNH